MVSTGLYSAFRSWDYWDGQPGKLVYWKVPFLCPFLVGLARLVRQTHAPMRLYVLAVATLAVH